MSKNNYKELDKIMLDGWVNKALDQGLSKQNIKFGFKVTRIWPINLRAMVDKILPSEIYTTSNNNLEDEDEMLHQFKKMDCLVSP